MAQPARINSEPQQSEPSRDTGVAATLAVIDLVFGPPPARAFDITLWDGSLIRGKGAPRLDYGMHIRRRGALRRMLIRPSELSIVEAFISGDIDITGNLERAMSIGDEVGSRIQSLVGLASLLPKVLALPKDDDPDVEQSQYKRALKLESGEKRKSTSSEIEFHYGVGNDFYALWLDPRMQYSCAYYHTSSDSLADAQAAKLDHICRKLRLKPGDTLLDIGCGWGGLIQYAARHYGVDATGITLSQTQAAWARRSIAENNLGNRCRVEVRDLRDLPPAEQFDKISSVGMMEHVPEAEQEAYFARAFALLRSGGLFMNHCIVSYNVARSRNTLGDRVSGWLWKRDQFIDRYVFPDGKLVALGGIVSRAERVGFEVRDVENLREHYAMTLRAWIEALDRRKNDALALVGERTFRIWRLYMSASAHSFNTGAIGLTQTVLAKSVNGQSSVPLTREDLYA